MYEIMTADEAIRLIRDGDCICVNSFVGIENPITCHSDVFHTLFALKPEVSQVHFHRLVWTFL